MQRPPILIRKRKEEGGRVPNGHDRPQHDNAQPAAVEAGAAAADEADAEAAEPERTELLGLEQLLYRDASASPLLEKSEEQRLTRQARAAWQSLLAALEENRAALTAPLSDGANTGAGIRPRDTLSERDVVALLERVHDLGDSRGPSSTPESIDGPGDGQRLGVRATLLADIQERLERFRGCRDELVQRNLRLVISLARHYQDRGIGYLDLVQEGTFGLMRAIEKFDPAKDVRFGTYAIWWIWQAMSRAQQLHGGAVIRTPTTVQADQRRLLRLTSELEGAFLRAPTEEELREAAAETLGTRALPDTPLTVVSLDAPLKEGEEGRLGDVIAQVDMLSPEEEALKESLGKKLREVLTSLPAREEEIVRLRFGFDGNRTFTLEEIGARLGLTKERVRQLEWRARKRLKVICQKAGMDRDG